MACNRLRLKRIDPLHAEGVLCSYRREGGHTVDTKFLKSLDIRLDSGPAAAVGASNGQRFRDAHILKTSFMLIGYGLAAASLF
ncbi:hypothetical protein D3C81_1535090 [compost metagenome]